MAILNVLCETESMNILEIPWYFHFAKKWHSLWNLNWTYWKISSVFDTDFFSFILKIFCLQNSWFYKKCIIWPKLFYQIASMSIFLGCFCNRMGVNADKRCICILNKCISYLFRLIRWINFLVNCTLMDTTHITN